MCEVLVTAAEIFLKLAARETASTPPAVAALSWLGLNALWNHWTWAAVPCMIASFAAWIRAVSLVPLNVASLLSNVVHIFVPVSCLLFLGEHISPQRWIGIALVCVGLALVKPPAVLEEKAKPAAGGAA